MKKTTYIVKRVQKASNGAHTYIVRQIEGEGGNLGVTFVYECEHLEEMFGSEIIDEAFDIMPELYGEPDNMKAVKITTTVEEVDVLELFAPIK